MKKKIMDTSYESKTPSKSETSPLLDDQASRFHRQNRQSSSPLTPRKSIFSCAVICILFTELCERLTYYGILGNLVLFITAKGQLELSPQEASIISYVFQGTCYVLPVFMGWLADAVAGKFSVIFFSAIVYLVGAILLPIGSFSKTDKHVGSVLVNPNFKKAIYIIGLFVVAFGTGGIKANVSPFGADQVSNKGPQAIQKFFIWFYWFINIGAFISFTLVVWVQQDKSYFYGYLIPTCSIFISLVLFVSGKRTYNIRPPAGSVLSNTLKIAKEAWKKSRSPSLPHPDVQHWLDRAKVRFGGRYNDSDVENMKKVYRLIPVFATFVLYWTVYAQMSTSMVYQGEYMDIDLSSDFQIPIASLSLLDTIGVLVLIPIMDKLVYPLLKKCNVRLSQLQRIGVGMVIATLSMACAGGIELYRKEQCCMNQTRGSDETETKVSNITIFYQVPQYTLIGLSEVFTSITGLELAYTEAPKSLQGAVMGIYLLTTGLGTYLGAALVAIVNAITGAHGESGEWYPNKDHINDGKLANYFFLLAGLMFLNFILYIFVACDFKVKKETSEKNIPKIQDVYSSSQTGETGVLNKPD